MTDTTKAQILEVARKAIHTEMLTLKRMEDTLGDAFATAVELILESRGKCIITGMGKSGLVGRKIAATLASTGTPSFFLHPGEAFHGDLGMISKEDIVVALSYSGETDEILKIVPFIHSNGNKIVSMTGNPDSALAKNSDVHLDVGVKEEACILHLAPTSSTTAQIAMGDALAVSLMQMRKIEVAAQLTVKRVFHGHIHHDAALVHHGIQLLPHLVCGAVDTGENARVSPRRRVELITPGRCVDLSSRRPQQGHVTHHDLPRDPQFSGQYTGTQRCIGLRQPL